MVSRTVDKVSRTFCRFRPWNVWNIQNITKVYFDRMKSFQAKCVRTTREFVQNYYENVYFRTSEMVF